MPLPEDTPITEFLDRARGGDSSALDELMPLIYRELLGLARSHLNRNRAELGTESLVHEAYLRLAKVDLDSRDRAQFFALASKAMRTLLIDAARRSRRIKRGGDQQRVEVELEGLASGGLFSAERAEELLALDQALEALKDEDLQLIQIVECRFFGGLSVEDTARALELSPATVKRRWAAAKLRLYSRLDGSRAPRY